MAPKTNPGNGSGGHSSPSDAPAINTSKLDNFVPTFSNMMQDYREYRKRCEIYKRKMDLSSRGKEVVYNLITVMTGKSWDLVEDMDLQQMEAADAYEKLFERLDKGFRYDPLTELPDDLEQYFVRLQRKSSQTLQEYMNDYTRAERKLEVTHKVKLPEKVRAWWFLRKSGITQQQRQLILTNTGVDGLTIEEVRKAMNFILGQDSRPADSSAGRWNRPAKASDAYYFDDETQYDWNGWDDGMTLDSSGIYYGEEQDAEEWADGGEEYYAEDLAAYVDSGEAAVYDVEEFDDVHAAYQDAKAKLNALRTARGFFPVVAMIPERQSSPGRHKGSSNGRGKGKPPKGKGKQMPKGKAPNPKGRAAAAMGKNLCLRCGNYGHHAKHCPIPPGDGKKRKHDDDAGVNMVESIDISKSNAVEPNDQVTAETDVPENDITTENDISPANTQVPVNDMTTEDTYHIDGDYVSDDTAMQDGGAASVLGSAWQIKMYLRFLLENGFNIHDIPMFHCEKGFKYGNSQKEITNQCIVLPTFIGNKRIDVLTYIIAGEAPILVGRPLLEQLGLTIDYMNKQMKWPDTDWETLPTGPEGEHLLHLGT